MAKRCKLNIDWAEVPEDVRRVFAEIPLIRHIERVPLDVARAGDIIVVGDQPEMEGREAARQF